MGLLCRAVVLVRRPQASRQVARRSGPLDAQLFMVKHLLFLREQIAPFDVDFSAVDIDLDFSHMREHLRRIMAGETSLFALGSNNAVVRMLGSGGPRVLTYQVCLRFGRGGAARAWERWRCARLWGPVGREWGGPRLPTYQEACCGARRAARVMVGAGMVL